MMALTLGLAIIGFVALLVAIYLGSTLWAWICVGVAAVGVVLSIIEALRHRRIVAERRQQSAESHDPTA